MGSNVIIGANSLVTKDIPNDVVVAGNPARVIRDIDSYYEKRKKAELDEAVEMVNMYYLRYGQNPPLRILREHFWLFENEYNMLDVEYKKVMHLVDGSFDLSCNVFKKHKAMFGSYEDFIRYCESKRIKKANLPGDQL